MPAEDPKMPLAKFISEVEGGAPIDAKSDFPTAAITQAQLYHRLVYRLGVTPAKEFADDFATIMLSFMRRSRGEVVCALRAKFEEAQQPEELGGPKRGEE